MAQENINLGAFPNDPDADPVRIAFLKAQNNFTELFGTIYTTGVSSIQSGNGISVNTQTGAVTVSSNIAKVTIQTDNNLKVGIGSPSGNSAIATSSNNIFALSLSDSINMTSISASSVTGTLATAAQPNITSVGVLRGLTLSAVGSGLITPSVTANSISANSISSPTISAVGSNTQVLFNNNSVVGASANLTFNGNTLTVLGNVSTNNANLGNLATANYLQGTLTTSAQPNITSLGTLSRLTVTGDITCGNINLTGVVAVGNLVGNGAGLTNILGQSVVGAVSYATTANAVAGANVSGQVGNALVSGTVYTGAQPNITSIGTLTSLTVSGVSTVNSLVTTGDINSDGNLRSKNVTLSGNVTLPGNINAGQVVATGFNGSGANLTNISGANVIGNVSSANVSYLANIPASASSGAYFLTMTSVTTGNVRLFTNSNFGFNADTGTLNANTFVALSGISTGSLTATGNASVGNLTTNGTIGVTGGLTAGSLRSSSTLIVSGSTTTAGLTSSADITTPLNLIGGAVVGTGYIRTPLLTTGSNVAIGTITGNWQLSPGSKLTATFADLAEVYAANKYIEPGTVVDFDGDQEVIESYRIMSTKVAGVVSTDPAYVLNSAMECEFPTMVALQGRVPCKVIGKVRKGDMLVSAGGGVAKAEESPKVGSVIGKSLENFDGGMGVIEIAVGRF